MKIWSSLFFLMFVATSVNGQEFTVMTPLDNEIRETSGLIRLNNQLITHNDSGGKPVLYEIDSLTGKVGRRVFLENGKNVDWEDICMDDQFIYIGDFGNNKGNRTNLQIYKVSISNYLSSDTVKAEKIKFSYADQVEFETNKYANNFDAETLISIGDSLYLFTKNWQNFQTRVYAIPKSAGTYSITSKGFFDAQCLVTAGDYNPENHTILLIGYFFDQMLLMRVDQFEGGDITHGRFTREQIKVPAGWATQIEAITQVNRHTYCISSETYKGNQQVLYKLELDKLFPEW